MKKKILLLTPLLLFIPDTIVYASPIINKIKTGITNLIEGSIFIFIILIIFQLLKLWSLSNSSPKLFFYNLSPNIFFHKTKIKVMGKLIIKAYFETRYKDSLNAQINQDYIINDFIHYLFLCELSKEERSKNLIITTYWTLFSAFAYILPKDSKFHHHELFDKRGTYFNCCIYCLDKLLDYREITQERMMN